MRCEQKIDASLQPCISRCLSCHRSQPDLYTNMMNSTNFSEDELRTQAPATFVLHAPLLVTDPPFMLQAFPLATSSTLPPYDSAEPTINVIVTCKVSIYDQQGDLIAEKRERHTGTKIIRDVIPFADDASVVGRPRDGVATITWLQVGRPGSPTVAVACNGVAALRNVPIFRTAERRRHR